MFETEELAREEVERVETNQSIPVLELGGVRDRGAGQGGGGEGGLQSINPCSTATRCLRQRSWGGRRWRGVGPNHSIPVLELRGVETEELAREEMERGEAQSINFSSRAMRCSRQRSWEEVERVGSNQSIPVLELQGV